MTEQALESPGDVFLRSGNPELFLTDNLPITGAGDQGPEPSPGHLRTAVLIGGAFLAWRSYMRSALRQELAPADVSGAAYRLWRKHAPTWMRIAVPLVKDAYAAMNLNMTPDELEAVASDYAADLGQYVHQSSAQALVEGYTQQLSTGISPTLAWMRVTEAYGLDSDKMRRWLKAVGVDQTLPQAGQVVSPGARRALDRALLQRADILGDTESWNARQVGKSIVWMAAKAEGRYPPGTLKRWLTADDERVCPICGPLHKQEVEIEAQFILPDGRTLWAPGVHPRCRCELELVYPIEAQFELIKARGGDPYDRDPRGRFANREQRRTQTQTAPVQDAYLTDLMRRAADLQSEEPADADLGPVDADLLGASLMETTDLSLVPDVNLMDADLVGAMTSTAPARRGHRFMIFFGGKPIEEAEEADPDEGALIYSPAYFYQDRVNQTGGFGVDHQYSVNELVDFDHYTQLNIEAKRQDPTYKAEMLRAGQDYQKIPHSFDGIHSPYLSDEFTDDVTAYLEARHDRALEATTRPQYFITKMSDEEVRQVFRDSGNTQTLRDEDDPFRLRAILQGVIALSDEAESRQHLREAYIEWVLTHDPSEDMTEWKELLDDQPEVGFGYFVDPPPQVFTWPKPTDGYGGVWLSSRTGQPIIQGRYRVDKIILHSEVAKHGALLPNARVLSWNEIRLKEVPPETGGVRSPISEVTDPTDWPL